MGTSKYWDELTVCREYNCVTYDGPASHVGRVAVLQPFSCYRIWDQATRAMNHMG